MSELCETLKDYKLERNLAGRTRNLKIQSGSSKDENNTEKLEPLLV